jgi:putative transposase
MPPKNSRKTYIEQGYYHIYNRGVEKRTIFQDPQDYAVFFSYLKNYLSPKNDKDLRDRLADHKISTKDRDTTWKLLRMNNFSEKISLLAYCLMPNHFHLFVKQNLADSIDKFMNSIGTRYTLHFNRKYDRVGSLYEGTYKAVLITSDEQLVYLTKYIHKQALSLQGDALQGGQPSSYEDYIGLRNTPWVHPEEILAHFSNSNVPISYSAFVKDTSEIEIAYLGDLAIEK